MHAVDGAADKSPRKQVLEDVTSETEVDEPLKGRGDCQHYLVVDIPATDVPGYAIGWKIVKAIHRPLRLFLAVILFYILVLC